MSNNVSRAIFVAIFNLEKNPAVSVYMSICMCIPCAWTCLCRHVYAHACTCAYGPSNQSPANQSPSEIYACFSLAVLSMMSVHCPVFLVFIEKVRDINLPIAFLIRAEFCECLLNGHSLLLFVRTFVESFQAWHVSDAF